MGKSKDLKDTLNLPRTSFSMKANLPQNEPKMLEKWESSGLYARIREVRKDAPAYTLHDGPPYANGKIHLGTALNKMIKDFVVRAKTMSGFNAPYRPGWDCHGLPIEIKVDQELGAKKAQMSAAQFRLRCRSYAEKYVEIQRKGFKRLGVLGEWDKPYLTMEADYQATIAQAFVQFLEKGYVYRGLKPVHYCISCKTALAEAEVEYEERRSPSIYVKYALLDDPAQLDPALKGRKVSVLIWTTTPWTLPASMAVAFHPKFTYLAVANGEGDVLLVESRRHRAVQEASGLAMPDILARISGKKFDRVRFQHPFLEREVPGVLATYVTATDGTGCVHTAPGHGREDFETGTKYGLEIYCPVGRSGEFVEGLPEYSGKMVFDANEPIIKLLEARGALLGSAGRLDHSYPHCWRCHNPVIFRASLQWFISVDHDGLRQKALDEIHKVRWLPKWGEERITNMIAARPDWCISRQRIWGVPITVFYCEACEEPLLDPAIGHHVVSIFRREGADAWYKRSPEELMPAGTRCPECKGSKFYKEKDILDVWFDSGTSHLAVLGDREDLPWPSDMYLEAGDQHRGWFHSSLLIGVALRQSAPYRVVMTHGWVIDPTSGGAMSKSAGNVINPEDVVKDYGAEILRLWVASVVVGEDVMVSRDILGHLSDAYRKFRNTFRYCLANLNDFDPATDMVEKSKLEELDAWALSRTAEVLERVYEGYEEFSFHKVYRTLYDFTTIDLSAFYFDIIKDRLYTSPPESRERRAAQSVLYRLLDALVRAVAPVLCFTAEEVWQQLPSEEGRADSVHLARFIPAADLREGLSAEVRARLENWPRLVSLRNEVLKVLEAARNKKLIGNPLEAKVRIRANQNWVSLLNQYKDFLATLFIVSQVETTSDSLPTPLETGLAGIEGSVERAEGEKCSRCWNYSTGVGRDERYPTVCPRCSKALGEIVPVAS